MTIIVRRKLRKLIVSGGADDEDGVVIEGVGEVDVNVRVVEGSGVTDVIEGVEEGSEVKDVEEGVEEVSGGGFGKYIWTGLDTGLWFPASSIVFIAMTLF